MCVLYYFYKERLFIGGNFMKKIILKVILLFTIGASLLSQEFVIYADSVNYDSTFEEIDNIEKDSPQSIKTSSNYVIPFVNVYPKFYYISKKKYTMYTLKKTMYYETYYDDVKYSGTLRLVEYEKTSEGLYLASYSGRIYQR